MTAGFPQFFRSLKSYRRLDQEQWLPAGELEARQHRRLEQILRHAYEQIPHYRKAFDEVGIHPGEIQSKNDLVHLPLLKREHLRELSESIARSPAAARLQSSFTSGSTAEGARTYFDDEAWLLGKYLLKLRARLACGVRPWDRIAQFQWIPNRDTPFRRHLLRQKSFGIDRDFDDVLSAARSYRPTVLYGFPGYLQKLGKAARDELKARLVFASGEMMSARMRTAIEEAFGATVYDVYGCTEMKEIAWECEQRRGYHINADWLVVEILAKPSGDVPAGSIVVTSLYNYAMPLIRYVVGDIGRLVEGACGCGRTLPLMAPDTGRAVDYVVLRDGREVSPYTVMTPVEALSGVSQFEILQEDLDRLLVRVVPSPTWGEITRETIQRSMNEILPGVRIEIALVEKIEQQYAGKYRIVQSRVARHRG
jgi:phenylacetate-CoA ligase